MENSSTHMEPIPEKSIKDLFLRGSMWVFMGQIGGRLLRLASNLILTRLLYPEAFGLMAILTMMIYGLSMVSDLGLNWNIFQSKRGEESDFIDTVWTVQIIRGCLIWIATLLFANPLAEFYHLPEIAIMFPILGFGELIYGFASTKIFVLNKQIRLGVLTRFEFGSEFLTVLITIAIAYFYHSVWSL